MANARPRLPVPVVAAELLPSVSVAQMREVDRLMTEVAGISLIQMMENAGRALADLTRGMVGGDVRGRRISVLAGSGGNGGGGLVAARRLAGWGADVEVVLTAEPDTMRGAVGTQVAALALTGARIGVAGGDESFSGQDVVLDALIGYSLSGPPRGAARDLIEAANRFSGTVIALDIPSGLDGDTGEASGPAVRAAATLTLALPKHGLVAPGARQWVGDLYVADISVPAEVHRRAGTPVSTPFATADLVRRSPD